MTSVTTTVLSTSQKTTGRSGASVASTTEAQLWKLHRATEDFLYPLYEECSTHSKIPNIIVVIHFIVQFFQLSVISSMLVSKEVSYRSINSRTSVFLAFADFGMTYKSFDEILTQFIVIVVIYGLMIVLVTITIIYHRSKKTFLKIQVATWQTFCMVIINILICPTAIYSGKAFVAITTDASIKNIILFLISVLIFVSFFTIHIFSIYMFSQTPFLVNNISGGWDPRPNVILAIITFLGAITGTAVESFAHWLMYLFIIFILLLFIVVYRYYLYFPHYYYGYTIISASLIFYYIYNCIISILQLTNAFPIDYSEIVSSIGFGIIIIALIVNIIIFKKRRDNVIKILNNEEPKDDTEKYKYFDSLTFKNMDHAKMMLRIGIKYHCKLFIDFSFIRYLLDFYSHPAILLDILQFLSYFPSQQQMLSVCLSLVSNLPNLNIFQKYLLFQVHRIHILRQSTISIEGNKQLASLEKHSNEVIATIRGFWNEIIKAKSNVTMASLKSLAVLSNETNSVFLDTIEKYPNSQKIYECYCRYLIEGMGDYRSAIRIAKIAYDMELGKRTSTDHSYHLFVNLFPDYIKLGILNQRGSFIDDELDETKSEQSFNTTESDTSSSSEGFGRKYDDLIPTLFTHSKLRLLIQNSLKHYKFNSLIYSTIIAIIQFVILIALCLITIYICSYCTTPLLEFFKTNPVITNISTSIEYISIIGAVNLLNLRGYYEKEQLIKDIFPTLEEQQNLTDFSTSYFDTFVTTCTDIIKDLIYQTDTELRIIYDNSNNYIQEINVLNDYSTNEYKHLSETENFTNFPSTLRSYIHYAALILSELVSRYNDLTEIPLLMLKYIMPVFLNTPGYSSLFILLEQNLKTQIDEEGDRMIKLCTVLPIILGVIALIAFVLLGIPFYNLVKKDSNKILKIIENFKEEDIIESFQPIYLKNKGKLTLNSSHSTQEKDSNDIGLASISFLAIILLCVLFIILIISMKNIIEYLKDINSLAELNSRRLIALLSIILRSIVDKTSYSVYFPDKQDYEKYINVLISYNLEITQKVISLNDESSYYIKDECEDHTNLSYSQYLNCISINNKVNILMRAFSEFVFGNEFRTSSFSTIIYLLDLHLFNELRSFQDQIYQITYNYTKRQLNGVYGLVAGLIFVTLVLFIYEIVYIYFYSISFKFFHQMILLLPPISIVHNKLLMDNILDNNNNIETNIMTPSESILNSSNFSIITVDPNLIIQNINPSLQQLTGLLPDQILGRSLNWFIPLPTNYDPDSKQHFYSSRFYSYIEEIQVENNEIEPTIPTYCITESNSLIFIKASLIPLFDNNNKLTSITILMENMETETNQKQLIHEAKERNKQLINALIPKQLLDNNNNYQQQQNNVKNLMINNDSAVVIYVELVGTENNVFSMLPKNLISSLSLIYDAIEEIKNNYPSIQIIRENSTNIIACIGLLDNNEEQNLKENVKHVVFFCEDLIEHFENPSSTVNLSIQPRIGIALGQLKGNVIIENEIPLFRVGGDAIDMAQDVESEAPLGMIVVTEDVKDLLNHNEFKITEGYRKDLFNIESYRNKK